MIDHLINNNCCSCDCEGTPFVDVETLMVKHISNDNVHVSAEDRSKWDKAAETISSTNTTVDLSLIENDIDNIKDQLEDHIEDKNVHLSSDDKNKLNLLKSITQLIRGIDLSKYIEKGTLSTINGKRIDQGGNIKIEIPKTENNTFELSYISDYPNDDTTNALGTVKYTGGEFTIYAPKQTVIIDDDDPVIPDNPDTPISSSNSFTKAVYRGTNSKQAPTTPVGGEFSFDTYMMSNVSGWHLNPAAALKSEDGKYKYIWVSYNTFFKEGERKCTGWSEPELWYDIDAILEQADKNAKDIADDVRSDAAEALRKARAAIDGDISTIGLQLNGLSDTIKGLNLDNIETAISGIIKVYSWQEYAGTPNQSLVVDNKGYTTLELILKNLIGAEYFDKFVKLGSTYYHYTASSLEITNMVSSLRKEIDGNGGIKERLKVVENTLTDEEWRALVVEDYAGKVETAAIKIIKDAITLAVVQDDATSTIKLSVKDGESSTEITSDQIVLNGDVISKAIISKELNINNKTYLKENGKVILGSGTNGRSEFNTDGSGSIANGNLNWNPQGDLNVTGTINAKGGSFKGEVKATNFQVINKDTEKSMIDFTLFTEDMQEANPELNIPINTPVFVIHGEEDYIINLTRLNASSGIEGFTVIDNHYEDYVNDITNTPLTIIYGKTTYYMNKKQNPSDVQYVYTKPDLNSAKLTKTVSVINSNVGCRKLSTQSFDGIDYKFIEPFNAYTVEKRAYNGGIKVTSESSDPVFCYKTSDGIGRDMYVKYKSSTTNTYILVNWNIINYIASEIYDNSKSVYSILYEAMKSTSYNRDYNDTSGSNSESIGIECFSSDIQNKLREAFGGVIYDSDFYVIKYYTNDNTNKIQYYYK